MANPKYAEARRPIEEPKLIAILESGRKIKQRSPRMRACNEKDAKGKLCAGHLKRWFDYEPGLASQYGDEIYRCEKCGTIYLPNPEETPRTGTLAW